MTMEEVHGMVVMKLLHHDNEVGVAMMMSPGGAPL